MDINSIIEMIEKSKRETGFKTPDAIYNEACDDIIEQLRKMSDHVDNEQYADDEQESVSAILFYEGEEVCRILPR